MKSAEEWIVESEPWLLEWQKTMAIRLIRQAREEVREECAAIVKKEALDWVEESSGAMAVRLIEKKIRALDLK